MASAGRAKEVGAIKLDLVPIDFIDLRHTIHIKEIVFRAAHYIGMLQVLDNGGSQLHGLRLMGCAEIGVVVHDGTAFARQVEQLKHLVVQRGIQGIV